MHSTIRSIQLLALVAVTAVVPAQAQHRKQITGADVLIKMRDKYHRWWYHTLTFSQKTTIRNPDGSNREQTWYESLWYRKHGGALLRIDTGDPAIGNGSLSSADTTWAIRKDTLARTSPSGNPFIPLIENVYLQPVAETVRQLASLNIDMTRATTSTWHNHPVYIVGVSSPSDTTTPQFWVDQKKLVLDRMILQLAPNRPPFDIQLDNYVSTGGGWLATKVTMFSNGVPQQTEEYYGWKTNVKLDERLFDPKTWGTAKHWAHPQTEQRHN